jgi:protocatechuate 3,4-dioxygenase beta subunit
MATRDDHDPHDSDDDRHHAGLAHDLQILTRRRMLGMMAKTAAGLSLAPGLVGCSTDSPDPDPGSGSCTKIPVETPGPFPGDGTNGANALALAGIVRSDIRASIAGATGVAAGVVLTVVLTVVDASTCAPLAGHAVYLWHCDRDGNYSMYSTAAVNENYLRGVQVTDVDGRVSFTTTFPGCYPGRWPHIHFEIYASAAAATTGANARSTSQLALPMAACSEVYGSAGYGASVTALSGITLASDNVFRDGSSLQIATTNGSVAAGYTASLTVAIS